MTHHPVPPEREQPPRWQIGQLATLAATTARAVRLYEAAGLMPEPARSAAGYRRYGPPDLATLIRIRRLRGLGFELEQIRAILSPEEPADLAAALAVLREDLLRRVEALHAAIGVLDGLRAEVLAGDREVYDALAPVLQAALACLDPIRLPALRSGRQHLACLTAAARPPGQRAGEVPDLAGLPA
jgi:DNA-binding transcriptional MerR regulator